MFKKWLENYQKLAIRTRWLSILGALILVFLAGVEIWETVDLMFASKIDFGPAIRLIGLLEVFPLIVLALLILRILILTIKNGEYNYVGSIAWLSVAITSTVAIFVIWFELTQEVPRECVPEPDKICFNFYDMRQAPRFPVASFVYVILGTLRFAVTGLVAVFVSKAKLK